MVEKLWRALFERYELGDIVMVRKDAPWIYKGLKGEIVKMYDRNGERFYLIEIDKRLLAEKGFLRRRAFLENSLRDAQKSNQVGWFRSKYLVLIG